MTQKKNLQKGVLLLGAALASSQAMAAGYEKTVTWSGEHAGVAGAAVATATGGDALYFNPAGMIGAKGGNASANFSPIFGKFDGPVVSSGTTLDGNRKMSPLFGVLGSYAVTPEVALGAGVYLGGGTKAVYEDVDFTSRSSTFVNLKPTVKSELSVVEGSLGAAYEPIPDVRVGIGWRVLFVNANLASASVTQQAASAATTLNSLTAVQLNDLKDTRWNGFRLGAQWTPKDAGYGLGVSWRSRVDFVGEGTVTGQNVSNVTVNSTGAVAVGSTTSTDIVGNGGPVTLGSSFPMQLSVGGFYDVMPTLRALVQYDFTEYSIIDYLDPVGTATVSSAITAINGRSALTPINQYWQNQNVGRIGFVYTGIVDWTWRAGYAYTSKVTTASNARPTFTPAASGHTVTLGAGRAIMPNLVANAAIEYSWNKGTVTADDLPTSSTLTGEYKAGDYGAHLGVTYQY